jgi:hypothetical protein
MGKKRQRTESYSGEREQAPADENSPPTPNEPEEIDHDPNYTNYYHYVDNKLVYTKTRCPERSCSDMFDSKEKANKHGLEKHGKKPLNVIM